MDDSLPCLDLLEATPTILRGLMTGISEEDARWKPAEPEVDFEHFEGQRVSNLELLRGLPAERLSSSMPWTIPFSR